MGAPPMCEPSVGDDEKARLLEAALRYELLLPLRLLLSAELEDSTRDDGPADEYEGRATERSKLQDADRREEAMSGKQGRRGETGDDEERATVTGRRGLQAREL